MICTECIHTCLMTNKSRQQCERSRIPTLSTENSRTEINEEKLCSRKREKQQQPIKMRSVGKKNTEEKIEWCMNTRVEKKRDTLIVASSLPLKSLFDAKQRHMISALCALTFATHNAVSKSHFWSYIAQKSNVRERNKRYAYKEQRELWIRI